MSLVEAVGVLARDLPYAVVVTDGDFVEPGPRVLYVNHAFERMTGYSLSEVVGRSPRLLQGDRTSLAARKALARALRAGERHSTTLVNYRRNGEAYHCHIEVFPISDATGHIHNAIAIEHEVRPGPGRRARRA